MFVRLITTAVSVKYCAGISRLSLFAEHTARFSVSAMDTDKFRLPQRYAAQGESVWVEYAALAAKYKPINLGQGFPDFAAPSVVTRALGDVACDKNVLLHQYTRGFVSINTFLILLPISF